jgi:hypothetical protein
MYESETFAGHQGPAVTTGARPGAVTLIQRFGSPPRLRRTNPTSRHPQPALTLVVLEPIDVDARKKARCYTGLEGFLILVGLSLSTDSLQIIPSTWFTRFGIWGEPKCPGKSVNGWMSD